MSDQMRFSPRTGLILHRLSHRSNDIPEISRSPHLSIVIKKVHIKPHLQKKVRIDKVLIRLETFKNRTRQCKARTDIMVHLEDGSHCTSVSMKCSSLCGISSLGIASTSLISDLFCIQQIEDFGHVMKHRHSRHCPFAICLPYMFAIIITWSLTAKDLVVAGHASKQQVAVTHGGTNLTSCQMIFRCDAHRTVLNRFEPSWTKLNQLC